MDVHSGEPGLQRRETPLVEAPGSGVAHMESEPPRAAKAVQVTPVKEEEGHSRPQLAPGSRATKGPGGSCTSALQGSEPAGRRAKNPYTKKSRSTYGVDSEGSAISFDKKVRMERNKKRAVQTQRVRSNILFSKGVREYKERCRSMAKPTSVGAECPTSALVLPVATKEEEEEMVRITLEVERQEEESHCKRAPKAASAKEKRHKESHCSEDPCDHRPASGNETGVMVSVRHGLGSLRVLRVATTRVLPHTTMASVKKAVAESDGVCAEAKVSEAALKKEAAQIQKSVAATPIMHTPPRSTRQTSAILKQTTIKTCEPFRVTSGFIVSDSTSHSRGGRRRETSASGEEGRKTGELKPEKRSFFQARRHRRGTSSKQRDTDVLDC